MKRRFLATGSAALTFGLLLATTTFADKRVERPRVMPDVAKGLHSTQPGANLIPPTVLAAPPYGVVTQVLDSTIYDYQTNGSLGKLLHIVKGTPNVAHLTHVWGDVNWSTDRRTLYYYYNGDGSAPFFGAGVRADGGFRSGFGSLWPMAAGARAGFAAISNHILRGASNNLASHGFVQTTLGGSTFTDNITPVFTVGGDTLADQWPRIAATSDGGFVLLTTLGDHNPTTGIDTEVRYAKSPDFDGPLGALTQPVAQDSTDFRNQDAEWPMICSGGSGRVAIVVPDFAAFIHVYESVNSGGTWTETIISDASHDTTGITADSSSTTHLPWIDCDCSYKPTGTGDPGTELHVVWTALQARKGVGDPTHALYDYKAKILHWNTGGAIQTVSTVKMTEAYVKPVVYPDAVVVDGGDNHQSVFLPQIGFSADASVAYVVWSQFNGDDIEDDTGVGRGELMVAKSFDNGVTWKAAYNFTQSPSNDERYPSIAPINHALPGVAGDFYVTYQSDNTGGSFIQDDEPQNRDKVIFAGVKIANVTIKITPSANAFPDTPGSNIKWTDNLTNRTTASQTVTLVRRAIAITPNERPLAPNRTGVVVPTGGLAYPDSFVIPIDPPSVKVTWLTKVVQGTDTLSVDRFDAMLAPIPNPAPTYTDDDLARFEAWWSEFLRVNGLRSESDLAGGTVALPRAFALGANYPNPFNPSTTVRFDVPARAGAGAQVKLGIYTLRGELVRSLVDEVRAPGSYAVRWDGRDSRGAVVASGTYLYRMTAGDFTAVRKMVVLK